MGVGRLYRLSDNRFVPNVNYQLFEHPAATNWWGELTLTDYKRINDNDIHIIELADRRRGRCRLRKRVNRAVSGVPPRYVYQFTGTSPLEPPK